MQELQGEVRREGRLMASVVQIQIQVDPTNSVPTIQNVERNFDGMVSSIQKNWGIVGNSATATAKTTGEAMNQMGGHVATGLDSVRLLSQEFGLRMPRAIEAMLSRMPSVTTALNGLLGGMAAIAGVEIFARAITGAVTLYDKFINLNSALDEYNKNVEKARQADLADSHSLGTTRLRLQQQTHASFANQADAQKTHQQGLFDLGNSLGRGGLLDPTFYKSLREIYEARQTAAKAGPQLEARDALQRKQIQDIHEAALAQIELNHAQDASLVGVQKINAELAKKQAIDKETRSFQNRIDLSLGNPISPTSGLDEQTTKDRIAAGEAAAQRTVLGREEELATMKAVDAAAQASMQGTDLFYRKWQDDIRETTLEMKNQGKGLDEIRAKLAEIDAKHLSEGSDQAVKNAAEGAAAVRRARVDGLTGAARIFGEQDSQINENNTKYAGSPDQLHEANEAAAKLANDKLLELQRQFTERMSGIGETWIDSSISGYKRIEAEAAKASDQIEEEFTRTWGGKGVDQNSPAFVAAEQAKQDALSKVQQGAAAKKATLDAQNRAEDLEYDRQAAQAEARVRGESLTGWIASYRNATAEIQDAEGQRLARLANDAQKEGLTQQEVAQRRIDIEREANAQIAQQQAEMQHQVSNLLERAFQDPIGTIKSAMEKLMFDILAQWLMQLHAFQAIFGTSLSSMQPGGASGPSGATGGILGAITRAVGPRPTFGGNPSLPQSGPVANGETIPDSGGMVMTPSGPVPQLSSSPGVITNFAGAAQDATSAASSPALRSVLSNVHTNSTQTSIPAIRAQARQQSDNAAVSSPAQPASADITTGGTPSIAGDGTMAPAYPAGLPNIQNGLPGAPMPQSMPQSGTGYTAAANTAMGVAGAGMAGYQGYQDTSSAFKSGTIGGTFKGALGDAAAGATIGMFVGGPVGAAIGAGIGAAVGLAAGTIGMIMGEGGKLAARDYYKKTIFPEIENLRTANNIADPVNAISQVNQMAFDGMMYMTQHWGQGSASWVDDNYLRKEQMLAIGQLEARARGGAYAVAASANQFHTGGMVTGFGDLATSGTEGFIHALQYETVMNPAASWSHGSVLDAMNRGASPTDVARMYLGAGSSGASASAAPSGGDSHNWTVHAIDAKSFRDLLRGGGAAIVKSEVNRFTSVYAGDGISG
jgi:hypothetical protein